MKTILTCVVLVVAACDEGSLPPDEDGGAAGKADDAAIQCAENTESPLDGRNIEEMERTDVEPRVITDEAGLRDLDDALLLDQIDITAEHFGRTDADELVTSADSGVSAGQLEYGDLAFDIILFFEDEQSHGLAFHAGTLDPAGEIGINYDIVGCKSPD